MELDSSCACTTSEWLALQSSLIVHDYKYVFKKHRNVPTYRIYSTVVHAKYIQQIKVGKNDKMNDLWNDWKLSIEIDGRTDIARIM